MLTMKQLASLEKQGGSGKRCALPESGEEAMFHWKNREEVEKGAHCLKVGGSNVRLWRSHTSQLDDLVFYF